MMLLREKDQDIFKRWVIPQLETISDADAEVLADYVIALVVADDPEATIKRNCIDSLSDFLQDNTEPFVDTVIKVLKEKTFVHSAITKSTANGSQSRPGATPFAVAIPPIEFEPRSLQTTSTPPFGVLEGPTVGALSAFHHRPNRPTGSEPSPSVVHGIEAHYKGKAKRKLFERELSQPHEDEHKYHGLHGTMRKKAKQATRRERVNAEKRLVQNSFLQKSFPTFDSIPGPAYPQQQLPPPPPGLPPFDPSDPVAFMTMAAAFGVNILDMPPLPFAVPQRDEHNHQGPKLKCEAYHTKGFCVVGSACLYEHGGEIVIPADSLPDYTHGRASLKLQANQAGNGVVRENTSHNQSHSGRVGRSRAPFSVSGPNYDPSNTTLVVEQIPEDFASEDDVRSFFSSFGSITEVSMHAHKRLAVVKFNDHDTANRAYMSPKAVFDNRFVKVYWYRSDAELGAHKARFGDVHVGGMKQHQDDEREDPKEIAKRQAEAQKAFEERRRKTEEAAARAEEIDRQLDEKEEEMRIIREQLAEISGDQEDQQTLATLQAEAEDLFATHEPEAPAGRGRGSFRGNYRGRAAMTFAPHGRGAPFRGAYRGRGSGARYPSRSSVKRLDYRPRRLAVAGIEVNSSRDEALRQHLINIPECTSIERHPELQTTLILTFEERYQAEIFLDTSRGLSDVGKLDLSWIPNDAFGGIRSDATAQAEAVEASDDDISATIGEDDDKPVGLIEEQQGIAEEPDMDVADDVDQWL